MKQCPSCKRTYTDETLLYCLEDGTVLSATYDPEATQVMPAPRITDVPPPDNPLPYHPPQQVRSNAPVYVLIALLLLVLGGGAVTLLIFGYSRLQDSSSTNLNKDGSTQSPQPQNSSSPAYPSPELPSSISTSKGSPSSSPTPQSSQMVGTWRTNVIENNERLEITYTFFADGRSKAVFKDSAEQTVTHDGVWQYSDGTLFETFPSGAKGKGAIRWIDHDNFEITIIDNGIPLYSGLKRRYRRISDEANQ